MATQAEIESYIDVFLAGGVTPTGLGALLSHATKLVELDALKNQLRVHDETNLADQATADQVRSTIIDAIDAKQAELDVFV